MKNVIASFLLSTLLVGCATAKFDSNEYDSFSQVEALSRVAVEHCNNFEMESVFVEALRIDMEHLVSYTKYLPHDKDTHNIAIVLKDQMVEMEKRYKADTPSEYYCQSKLKIFNDGVNRAMKAMIKKVK